jgi:Glyoxalase-like domain
MRLACLLPVELDTPVAVPSLLHSVLDTTDARGLAEFYRQLLELRYRPGDEPPAAGSPDPAGQDWLVLTDSGGVRKLAFQQVASLPAASWPDAHPYPQQLHLDMTVPSVADLDAAHERALTLGARLLLDRSDDPQEPLRVYADPAGHPFCIFVVLGSVSHSRPQSNANTGTGSRVSSRIRWPPRPTPSWD